MKKLFKQLICFVLAVSILFSGIALGVGKLKAEAEAYSGTCGNNAAWSLDSGTLTITGNGATGAYQAVSGMKAPWYNHKEEILHIDIDEGITSIGIGSFQDCSNLLDVNLPGSLKEISEASFSGCNKLQTLYIPANVKNIDASAFLECSVLENISVDADNTYYSDVDGVLFDKDKTKIVLFPKGKITEEYSIPSGVTEIGAYAFANCSELIKIDIPDTVNTIGMYAFWNCRILLSADIPEGVSAIKSNTFYGCSALYEVKLPSTITVIGSNAFGKCGSLTKINIPNATKSIDASAFSSSPNLKVYCDKDSEAHKFCVANSIDFHYSNIATLFPMPASVLYNGHTYGRFDVACTWEEAKLVCEMLGGHLVTITSQGEHDIVKSLITGGNGAYWIGATDNKTEGTWEWVTGEAFDYTAWSSGEPNDWGGIEEYAEMGVETGLWNDNTITCSEYGFVCEYDVFFLPDKTVTYNGHIYSLYNESLSWTEAKSFCESMSGHLVTVSSQAEQDAINQLFELPKKAIYWIGFYDSNLDGVWEWVTGEPVVYTNWGSGEPNGANSTTHTYAQMYSTNLSEIKGVGCWNDEYNEGNGTGYYRLANIGFICETEPESFSPALSGYYNGSRYEVYSNNVSWESARAYAQTTGGHLATITDSDEAEYLQSLYKDLTLADDYLFTGGFRYKHETEYRWVTGERYSYSNWNSGEPNGNAGIENIIQIYRYSNGWNDIGNRGSYYDGSVFIVEYESPKQVLTLSNPDGTVLNRYKVQGGLPVDEPLKDYKPGYTAEWYKEPSLQNKWDFETDVITEDTVLYAHWVADTYTVSFETNGGECNTELKEVTVGSTYGELPVCIRKGYSFVGWYTDAACTVKADENTAVSIAANHTLYAKWQAETYTVAFKCNGGETGLESKGVVFGETYGELPLYTQSGCEFLGWYADENCTEEINENSIVSISQNHILYAGLIESTVASLKLITKPTKIEYYVGDSLDTTGLSIQATFANGSTGELSADRMIYSITEFNSAGKKIIKASYGEKYVSFIVNVLNRTLTSVSVASLPDKLSYTVGETLDTTGIILNAVYDDSSTKTITEGFTVTCDLSSAGTKTATVEYTENGVTVSTSYEVTVTPEVIVPDAVVSAESVSVKAGETISVPFRVENNKGFMGFAITVDYDSDAFIPVSVTPGATLGSGTLNDSIGTAYKYLKIVYVGSEDVTGDGDLFTVDFLVNENASGNYDFDVSFLQPDTFNESLEDVIFECNDFDVSVSNQVVEQSVIFIGGSVDTIAGTTVTVPVSVENGVGINSFLFRMDFNSDIMSFVSVSNGDVIVDGKVNSSVNESYDEISLSWSGLPIASDGVLFYVTFEIDEYVQSDEILSVLCENITFANGMTKDIICIDAEINISNPNGGDAPVIYSKEYLRIENSTIEVPVYIKNNHGIMGLGLNFEYDSSVISPVSVTASDMLSAGYFVDNIGLKDGNFKVLWNHTEDIIGNGLLMTLKFSVADGVKPETVPLTITYSQPDTYNEKWEDVALNINISEICISYIYTATFMHNGEIIGTDEFFADDESLDYPAMPEKPHYEWVWENHVISADDITVNGDYIPIEYTINFVSNGQTVKTLNYTVETLDSLSAPELSLPEKEGYYSEWESWEGKIGNLTVNEVYVAKEYTISFCCEGQIISQSKFTVETNPDQIDLPEVPNKTGYSGKWEDFTIVANNIDVNCLYTPVVYTATFINNGKVIGTDTFTIEDESLDYPDIVKWTYYDWAWDEHKIEAKNLTIEGRYVPITYTITFVSNGKVVKTQEYNVETVDSIVAPAKTLPVKQHYTTAWEDWTGKVGNITVNEVYVPVKYNISFYCQNKLVKTRSYTIETSASQIIIPEVPKLDGYTVKWPELSLTYKDQSVHAICTPIVYTAQFVVDGEVIATRTFTVETEKLNEPALPQKAGYIAAWSEYVIKAENMIIHAKYYSPEVIMRAKVTLKTDETTRLFASCNFETTQKSWTSSNPAVATVDKHGNVTAVGKGECKITVVCYGKDSFGNEIKATNKTEIVVKERLNAETLKERFRAAFDEFFQVKLHDFMYNFKKFMIILFRYAY